MLSIVIPLYRNEANLPRLFSELERLSGLTAEPLELVFVNDGSPDRCAELVGDRLKTFPVAGQLIQLSRNFGAFAAISAGLKASRGEYFAVLSADLQEPPELALEFLAKMRSGEADIVFGVRENRNDPAASRLTSHLFWLLYRLLVNREIPPGGVDVFGCSREVRDQLCAMKEVDTSLVALLFWVGYRRGFVTYERRPRMEGASAWTLAKKFRYLINSVFNFTDLPIRVLLAVGSIGTLLSLLGGLIVLIAWFRGDIRVPGYSPVILAIFFFGATGTLALGIIGQYLWLCLQNARGRPAFIIRSQSAYGPNEDACADGNRLRSNAKDRLQ